jgi:portal protein
LAYDTQDDDAEPLETDQDEIELQEEAITRFDDITMAVQEERALALSDRRFVSIAGAQWEGNWEQQFENSIMVEVNKTAQGVEKIIGDYRKNRVTVNFRGVDKGADEETADTYDAMFRADVYASKGQQAFDNAFEEGVQGGIGAWRLTNRYADEYDPDNDYQRICFDAVVDADQSVFWDMNAKLYDKSDARFAFVVTALSRQAFLKEYGDQDAADWPDEILKTYYDWYTPDVVRICEYYRVEDKTSLLRIFKHKATGEERREWAADLKPDDLTTMAVEGWEQQRTRKAKRRRILKSIHSGCVVLEEPKVLPGQCIPIVPFYGKRWFIDNMERSRGHVRLAKDPQRIYNSLISKLTETNALAPLERPIFTPEQIAGQEENWAKATIDRAPYALINLITNPITGEPILSGPIGKIEPPKLSEVLAALIQIASGDIAQLTASDDQAQEVKSNVSAEAMDIAATRIDAMSGIYLDNMRQSMQRCGEIYLSMCRDVNYEEGREVETMSEAGDLGTATLSEPYTDEKGNFRIRNDLTRGKYKVIADVTEATATRRDKTVKTLTAGAQIVAAFDPELAAAMTATAVNNMDGEGITDLQEWIRARGVSAGYIKPTEEEKAELEQAQQQQKPDPLAQLAQAQAGKEAALAVKAQADTELSKANTAKSLADAQRIQAETGKTREETQHVGAEKRVGIMERMANMFRPQGG